ncbi:MAG: hypothetical protein ABSH01_28525 [Terriglobia bacterium]|jgi:hypothetical protein
MNGNHILLGIVMLTATLGTLGWRYFTHKKAPLPAWGWLGLTIILLAELLLCWRVRWVGVFFTPIVWTGYLLFADSLVCSLKGSSLMAHSLRSFLGLACCSVPLWLVFEAYNLRLSNWTYIGLPQNPLLRGLGFTWSFATIWPAIFETADLVSALGSSRDKRGGGFAYRPSRHITALVLGLACLTLPLLAPPRVGGYLFGAVWVGFILLLEPINYSWGGRSLLRDLEQGETGRLIAFLGSGLVCGILWEFWNYWASAKWLYVFPIWQNWKVFEMPAPGFLGFPPFAVECLVMYEFLRGLRGRVYGV